MPTSSFLPRRWSATFALLALFLLAGCQSCSSEEESPSHQPEAVTPRSTDSDLDPRAMATRYMRYAYQGALLRSDHPLTDSLSALMEGPVGGQAVTVIDTFHVESAERVDDAEYTVNVRAPYAVDIKSVSWDTSPPVADKSFRLRTSEQGIREAPHVVGWPAFQRHIRDVAPEEAEAILKQVGSKLNESPS